MFYFLFNILKIAASTRHSVNIHQTSAFVIVCAQILLHTHQFLLVGVQGLVVSPGSEYPRYAITDTHTTGFWKVCY